MVTGLNSWVQFYQRQMNIVRPVAHPVPSTGNKDVIMTLFVNLMKPNVVLPVKKR